MASILWTPQLITLTKVLSDLFREEPTARTVTEEAGVPTALIDWREPSYMRWQSIIEEARRREMLPQLIAVATRWYEESSTLQEAVVAWEATLAKPILVVPVEVPAVLVESIESGVAVIAALRMTVADQEARIRALEEAERDDAVRDDVSQYELTTLKGVSLTNEWERIALVLWPNAPAGTEIALCWRKTK